MEQHTACIVVFFTAKRISQTGHNVTLYVQFQKVRDLLKLHCPGRLQPAFGHYSEPHSSIQFRFNVNLRSTLFSSRYHNFGYLNYAKIFNVNDGIQLERLVECTLTTLFLVGLIMAG